MTPTEKKALTKARGAKVDYGAMAQDNFDPNSLSLAQLQHCFIDFGVLWRLKDGQNKTRPKAAFVQDFKTFVLPKIIQHQQREAEEATYNADRQPDNKRRSVSPLPRAAPRKKVRTAAPRAALKRRASDAAAPDRSKRRSKRVIDLEKAAAVLDPTEREIAKLKQSIVHTKGARHVAFDVHHEDDSGKGYVFFYSSHPTIGGPFVFMSNFFKCTFQVEEFASGHIFTSMEQFYQFCKAKSFAVAREFLVELPTGVEVASYQMPQLVLAYDDPMDVAILVRAFVKAGRKKSERWYMEWSGQWKGHLDTILNIGLRAKFDNDQKLKSDLVKTGSYVLAEASPDDKSCGIGFAARAAFEKRDEWENQPDNNKLGKALMRLRDEYQQADMAATTSFDRAYYNKTIKKFWQDMHARQQKRSEKDKNMSKDKKKTKKH